MARNLLATVGESPVDNLQRDNVIYQNRIEVQLPAGVDYKRGQVLVLDDDGINAALPAATDKIVDCILLLDVESVGLTGKVKGQVSLTGQFNQNSVLWGAIPDTDIPEVIKNTRSERQLDIAPSHKAPYVQFGEE